MQTWRTSWHECWYSVTQVGCRQEDLTEPTGAFGARPERNGGSEKELWFRYREDYVKGRESHCSALVWWRNSTVSRRLEQRWGEFFGEEALSLCSGSWAVALPCL